jgi:hypothetical protein
LAVTAVVGVISFAATWTHSRWQSELASQREAVAVEKQRDSDEKIALANARAAEANRVAEEERHARLKLEQEMAWRSFSAWQKADFIKVASSFSGTEFELITYQDDPEAKNFANIIGHALVDAGWKHTPSTGFLAFRVEVGIRFEIAPEADAAMSKATEALAAICVKLGVAASSGVRKGSDKPYVVKIRIGKKPERVAR